MPIDIDKLRTNLTLAHNQARDEIESLESRLAIVREHQKSLTALLSLCETMADTSEKMRALFDSCGMSYKPDAPTFTDVRHTGATHLPVDHKRPSVGEQWGIANWTR